MQLSIIINPPKLPDHHHAHSCATVIITFIKTLLVAPTSSTHP
jgi:hypothetical protein